MKKILTFVFIFTLSCNFSHAQLGPKSKTFLELNFGTRIGGSVSDSSTLAPIGFHMDGAIGYMISPLIGIKGSLGYDSYKCEKISNSAVDRSYMIRASIQGVFNISDAARFGTDVFGLNFHGGFGFATNINPSFKEDYKANGGSFSDPALLGNDDMINFIFGLTQQYKVHKDLRINVDFSTILLPKQSHYLDRGITSVVVEKSGFIMNASVGVTYFIPPYWSRVK